MNVTNFLKPILLIVLLLLYSCNSKQDIEEENSYQIISLLINKYSNSGVLYPSFPPPPNNGNYVFSTNDSLRIYKHFYEETIRKKVINVNSKTFTLKDKNIFNKKCNIGQQLINLFRKKEIDLSKIFLYENDSLLKNKSINYNEESIIDITFNFSEIGFNKDYNKAIIVMAIDFEKSNGFSVLIYLKKENYHWKIKCEKELSIS